MTKIAFVRTLRTVGRTCRQAAGVARSQCSRATRASGTIHCKPAYVARDEGRGVRDTGCTSSVPKCRTSTITFLRPRKSEFASRGRELRHAVTAELPTTDRPIGTPSQVSGRFSVETNKRTGSETFPFLARLDIGLFTYWMKSSEGHAGGLHEKVVFNLTGPRSFL